jgi:hypothetical protein
MNLYLLTQKNGCYHLDPYAGLPSDISARDAGNKLLDSGDADSAAIISILATLPLATSQTNPFRVTFFPPSQP